MSSLTADDRKESVLRYFVLCYAVSWTFWLTASTLPAGAPRSLLFLLGTFVPGFIALGFTWRGAGRDGARALLQRLVDWNVPARWYFFAISFMAVIKLTAAGLHRLVAGSWPQFGAEPLLSMLAATVLSTVIGGQAGEELGWRGFALPRLASRFGLGGASVVLGILWATWHLPLFLVPAADTFGQSFPLYFLQVTALSVVIAWVCASVRWSLVPVMLLHAAVNNTKDIVPSFDARATSPWALSHSLVAWLTLPLLWVVAGYLLTRMSRLPPVVYHG